MFELLNKYINSYSDNDISEHWDELGLEDVRLIFNKFKDEDWEKLYHSLPNKSLEWKLKMISGICGNEEKVIKTISLMADTDNVFLLDYILNIYVFYNYNIYEDKYNIYSEDAKKTFLKRMKDLSINLDKIHKCYFDKFLEKNNVK